MMKRILAFVALSAVAGILLWALILYDRPDYRYIGYECQFDLIYNQSGPVDLAIIGSSRTQQGVGAPDIASYLKRKTGKETVVYELGKSWRGQGINYTILRDLLAHRGDDVKALLVEANLPETGTYHAHWYRVGRYEDFGRSIIYQQAQGPNIIPLFQMLSKILDRVMLRGAEFINQTLSPLSYRHDTQHSSTRDCMKKDEPLRPKALEDRAVYNQTYDLHGKTWEWDLNSLKAMHDTGFFKALVALAKSHNIPIYFYAVIERHNKYLNPEFAQTFKRDVGADLIVPPFFLVEAQNEDGYADPTHFNAKGRKRFSEWLASEYLKRQSDDKN